MATDAKIDELISSIEKLVKEMKRSDRASASDRASGTSRRSKLDLDTSATTNERQEAALERAQALQEEQLALERRKRVLDDLEPLEEIRRQQLKAETKAMLELAAAYDDGEDAALRKAKAYEELTEKNEKFDYFDK